jgi:putative DNA primase/helicase
MGFMCSKTTAVVPAKGVPVRWLQFLDEATEGDVELQVYLQKFVGYCLCGVVVEQFLPFIWGRTATGKSTFIDTIAGMLGTYWKPASLSMFQSSRFDQHPAELAELAGARLVTATETQEGRSWNEQRIKALTAGDAIQVHKKYGHPFTLKPTFKIVVAGNHEPTIDNLDDAMKRRLHVVPLDNQVPVKDRDEALLAKLETEWPQILKWALEGYVMWRRDKLVPPESVRIRTQIYFTDEDLIQQWVDEECDVGKEYEATTQSLFSSWEQWCNRQGHRPGSAKTLKKRLKPLRNRHSFISVDHYVGSRRQRGVDGLRVKPALEEGTHGDL